MHILSGGFRRCRRFGLRVPIAAVALAGLLSTKVSAQLTVSLTSPTAGTSFPAGGGIVLAASASPSAGASITNVQFFQGSVLLGQAATSPYTFTWAAVPVGSYSLQAVAFDSSGASLGSALVPISVLNTLPYATDFESSQGYAVGPLGGQLGWSVGQGDVEVTNADAFSGSQSVLLAPALPVAELSQAFYPASNSVVYIDLYAQPAADAAIGSSTLINAGGAEIGFLLNGSTALVETFNGNGQGSGSWIATVTNASLALSSGTNEVSGWHRFTFREDLSAKTWDLYVDGQMVAYDLKFPTPPGSSIGSFSMSGHATATTLLDTFTVAPTNPLFTNQSNDGISDAWKIQYGLDPTQNDRYLAPSGNAVPVIQEYTTGANPLDYYQGRAFALSSPPGGSQITYSYDLSGRVTQATFGTSASQSFTFDKASNLTSVTATNQPIVAWRTANNLPPDGSATGADTAAPAGDNLPNLIKYAFCLPVFPAAIGSYPSIGMLQSNGSDYLTLTYTRPDPAPADLTYTVQVSPDNQTWSNGSGAVTTVSTTVVNSQATVVVQDNTALGAPNYGRFIRLLVTRSIVSQ